jgi:hypothetical protein
MPVRRDKFHLLNLVLIPPIDHLPDATEGNEVIEIYIQDVHGCRPPSHYTIPITQPGQSFGFIKTNLLYYKDECSQPSKNIFVSIRILRGTRRRVIYTNDLTLLKPFYANGAPFRIPIYRVWHLEDYLRLIFTNMFP